MNARAAAKKLVHAVFPKRVAAFRQYDRAVRHGRGIEIGGPSPIFRKNNYIPLYPLVQSLDGCNFAAETVWQGRIRQGRTYRYADDRPCGIQYICDATNIRPVNDHAYDFLLAAHVLEHVADPIRALSEWRRIVTWRGAWIIVLPNRDGCFDRYRTLTSLDHMIEDNRRAVGEEDLTHLDEIVEQHDIDDDPGVGSREELRRRSMENANNRTMHHHTFTRNSARALFEHVGFSVVADDLMDRFHIIALLRDSTPDDPGLR